MIRVPQSPGWPGMDGPITHPAVPAGVALVAFDFDGTLADAELTVLLGRRVGAADRMAAITERAMAGELPYAESLRERVALLEGLPLDEVDRAFEAVELRPGAADVLASLAEAGVPTVILTGGFDRGVRAALDRAGVSVDRVVANRLVDDGQTLTGEVEGPLVEGSKADRLAVVTTEFDVPLADTVAVGDGANDRAMLEAAGLAVGYAPKPALTDVVDVTVDSMPALLQLLRRRGVLD